jgi:hypothetical protein
MKKQAVFFVILLSVASISFALVPHASAAPQDIKVLNYTWYTGDIGSIIVVGEVQNVGSRVLNQVVLSGIMYSPDNIAEASSQAQVPAVYLVPQEKAPFYMQFDSSTGASGDITWTSGGIDHFEFNVIKASETDNYQYPDLKVTTSSGSVDSQGQYWATGTITNSGNQTATNIRVIATFYNSTGYIVAAGFTGETPIAASVPPAGTVVFRVTTIDFLNQTQIPDSFKIQKYSFIVQADSPILRGTAPPPTNNTSNNDNSSSNNTDTPNQDPGNGGLPWGNYAITIVVVLAVLAAVVLIRRRKPQPTELKSDVQSPKKPSKRRKR